MPWDIPSFNAINDRQYLRPTYVDPVTGGLTYNNPVNMPQAQPPVPTMPSYGGMPAGGDFFSQLAGLFNAAQQPMAQRPAMGMNERLMAARQMPQVTGYGYGGGNRPLEQETRMKNAAQRKASMTGQFGRASGGRGRNGTAGGFQPSMNYGKPSVAEGFGDGRGFGGFR